MKTSFKKSIKGVFTFSLLVLIVSGCEDTFFNGDDRITVDNPVNANNVINPGLFDDYLLYASFEGDAIGSAPNKTLPGLPGGDALAYDAEPPIQVIASNGQKSVLLTHEVINGSYYTRTINFISKPIAIQSTDLIIVTWSGRTDNHAEAQGESTIQFLDNYGNWLMRLSIMRNSLIFHGNPGDELDPNDDIAGIHAPNIFPGSPINSRHTFTVTFHVGQGYYNVKAVNVDGSVYTLNNIPFWEISDTPPSIQKHMYKLKITGQTHGYVVDNVTIKRATAM